MTLYDINKETIKNLPLLDPVLLYAQHLVIDENSCHAYYMLYGREINYFTLFQYSPNEKQSLGLTVIELLKDIPQSKGVYSIEYKEDERAWEIWIDYNDEPVVLYLFNYNEGVVYYG